MMHTRLDLCELFRPNRVLTITVFSFVFYGCPSLPDNQSQSQAIKDLPTDQTVEDPPYKKQQGNTEGFSYRQISSLSISPKSILLAQNETIRLQAEAIYNDGSYSDLTAEVNWRITPPSTASIQEDNGIYQLRASDAGEGQLEAFYQSSVVSVPIKIISRDIKEIEIIVPILKLATPSPLRVRAHYADQSSVDVTDTVSWSVADHNIASIDNDPPQITPLLVGSTMVQANLGSIATGKRLVSVTPPEGLTGVRIELPSDGTVPLFANAQLAAIGEFANGDTLNLTNYARWISLTPDRLSVDMTPGQRGISKGLALGNASIKVEIGSKSASLAVPVSLGCSELELLPSDTITAYVSVDLPLKVNCLMANGSKSDKTKEAVFNFTATEASIIKADDGNVTLMPVAKTSAPVTGTVSVDNLTKSFTVFVEDRPLRKIEIQGVPVQPACDVSAPIQLTAIGTFGEEGQQETRDITESVTWSSLTTNSMSVDNTLQKGQITTLNTGYARIKAAATATDGKSIVTEAAFFIDNPKPISVAIKAYEYNDTVFKKRGALISSPYTLPKGASMTLSASLGMSCGSDLDGTDSANWTADSSLSIRSDSGSMIVTADNRGLTVNVGVSYQGAGVVETLTDSISMELGSHEVKSLVLRYPDPIPPLPDGAQSPYWVEKQGTVNLKAYAIYTDGYEQEVTTANLSPDDDTSSSSVHDLTISWQSLTPLLASVDNSGLVTGILEGSASIKATLNIDYNDVARTDPAPLVALLQDNSSPPNTSTLEVRSPCASDTNRYSYYCYELSAPGESCEQTCAAGIVQNEGMDLISNSDDHCEAVVSQLLGASYQVFANYTPGLNLGCSFDKQLVRDSNQQPSASFGNVQRACACSQ